MAILEQVMQLKEQGVSESEIVQYLKDQGILPKEINEALAQSKIKSELNREATYNQGMFPSTQNYPAGEGDYSAGSQPIPQEYSMQPSMMNSKEAPQQIQEGYPPEQYQDYQYQQPNQNYYPEYQSSDVETITEVTEQIIEEKTEKLKKQISALISFKEEISAEIEKISQRLEKIENNFNNLQASIIRKVGEYGDDISNIAKEMHATQESFSKIINPLTDNARKQHQSSSEPESKSRKTKKSGQFSDSRESEPATNFEDYLR